jgi:sugar lactone lactonase YvrE
LYDPRGAAFNPATGELFVGNTEGGTGGSIPRFWVDAAGKYEPDGTITGNGLETVGQMAFLNGELFAADTLTGMISRYKVDAQGDAIPNGTINVGAPYVEGLAFSPSGELFVSTINSSEIFRFRIDPSTGVATPNGTIANPGSGQLHHLAFLPNGDLFVASQSDNRVYRFSFDGSGNPVLDGSISVNQPVGLALAPPGNFWSAPTGMGSAR